MQRHRRSRFALTAAAILLAVPVAVGAQPPPPACIAGTSQTFMAIGALQAYGVPAGTTALLITADGASGGGAGTYQGTYYPPSQGAHLQVGVPVSRLSILDVVVGSTGSGGYTGGGGGGSFVFTPDGVLLVAAGGGGGSLQYAGDDAQLGQSGSAGLPGSAGGSGGSGGGGGVITGENLDGGGGGGFLGPGGDGADHACPSCNVGQGGHQISPPGDAGGGWQGTSAAGGFGGGGGGNVFAGGGGGGYSGGGGGADGPGGGGGSFWAAGGTTYASSVSNAGDGSVTICATASVGCVPSDTLLCLNDGRFKVTATFDAGGSSSGSAHAVNLTGDTGYLWFFSSANVEVIVKVLNGCGLGGHYWVFAGGLTNVKVTLTVTDVQTEAVMTYNNPQGMEFRPIQDTSAFSTCP